MSGVYKVQRKVDTVFIEVDELLAHALTVLLGETVTRASYVVEDMDELYNKLADVTRTEGNSMFQVYTEDTLEDGNVYPVLDFKTELGGK